MLTTIALATGCGKKNTSSPPNASQSPAGTNPPAAAAPQTPAASQRSVSSIQTNTEPDLRALDRSLIRWIVGHKKRPANFEEFAASAGTPIPPPPPGKKYVIAANMHIELVNQ